LFRGVAPGCHYVVIKVLNQRGEGNTEQVLNGIEWLLNNYKKYDIRIVNISVGSTKGKNFDEESPLVQGVNRLWSAGLSVFTAAGNHGPEPFSIGAPGNSRKIITVGSSDVMRNQKERDYSGRGPTQNCIKKPDIVAPGSHITSCYPMPSGSAPNHRFAPYFTKEPVEQYNGASYISRTGTSMSTPVVSGCVALLLEQNPNLTNKEIKLRLRNTALNLGYTHARQGWGLIQCDRLLAQ
ncbi:MAG: S8 family peptidase, partial [Clostridiaceae bacterium]|nr:S8 family peptidase [Clostridiaceae bacterium]